MSAVKLAGRDGLVLVVSNDSLSIARDGESREEAWGPEELWVRVGSLLEQGIDRAEVIKGARFALAMVRS